MIKWHKPKELFLLLKSAPSLASCQVPGHSSFPSLFQHVTTTASGIDLPADFCFGDLDRKQIVSIVTAKTTETVALLSSQH